MHHGCKGVQARVISLQRPPQVASKGSITAHIHCSTAGIVDLERQQEASSGAFPVVIEVIQQGWAAEDSLQLHVGNPACQLGEHDHRHKAVVCYCSLVQSSCRVLQVPSVAPLVDEPEAEDESHDAHKHQGGNLGSPAWQKLTELLDASEGVGEWVGDWVGR